MGSESNGVHYKKFPNNKNNMFERNKQKVILPLNKGRKAEERKSKIVELRYIVYNVQTLPLPQALPLHVWLLFLLLDR